jgi:hypothetical protein
MRFDIGDMVICIDDNFYDKPSMKKGNVYKVVKTYEHFSDNINNHIMVEQCLDIFFISSCFKPYNYRDEKLNRVL